MKAVGYIRVSSEMQIETGHSLDAQRMMINDYVRARGWTLCEVFCDPGLSGTLSNRPALQTLLSRAEQREFDVVIVHAIDRFYRDLGGLLGALHHLQQHRISFVSITENLDFTTPWGKLVLAVLGALGEIYIDKLREETKKGKQARARKGLWNGRVPFGYCNGLCASCTDVNGKDDCPNFGHANRSQGGVLLAHPIESIAVRLTYAWYEMGKLSHRLISERLNAYELVLSDGTKRSFRTKRCLAQGGPQSITCSTVREILSRIFYTGQVPYYGTNDQGTKLKRRNVSSIVPGQQPALVSQELCDRCQQLARARLGNLSRKTRMSRHGLYAGEAIKSMACG